MAWKPNTPERIAAFDRVMKSFPGLERRFLFGCPGYFPHGKMAVVLQQGEIVLPVGPEGARELLGLGGRAWSPVRNWSMEDALVVPSRVTKKPRLLRAWICRALAYAKSRASK